MSQATPYRPAAAGNVTLERLDLWLLIASLLLLTLGLIMVGSASLAHAERLYQGATLALLERQSIAAAVALAVAVPAFMLPLRVWQRLSLPLLAATVVALIALAIPLVQPVNGAARWFRIFGFSLQVSELAKLVFLIFLATHLQRKDQDEYDCPNHLQQLLCPLLVLGLLVWLFQRQPDFGSAAVLTAMTLGVLFVASVKPWQLIGVGLLLIVCMGFVAADEMYRIDRFRCLFDPIEGDSARTHCYQLIQALVAIGRGGLFGVGLGESVQKLHYLPEAHNDFLLAILAEELGAVGVLAVIGLYAVVVWRCFAISARAAERGWTFAAHLSYGIGLLLAIQVLINVGVNLGLLPTKGLTLPLLSYGGSSMIVVCLSLALVLRVHWELCGVERNTARRRPGGAGRSFDAAAPGLSGR